MTIPATTKPLRTTKPEGTYSTIRLGDGMVETILFAPNGGEALATVRSHHGVTQIQAEHIERIQQQLTDKQQAAAEPPQWKVRINRVYKYPFYVGKNDGTTNTTSTGVTIRFADSTAAQLIADALNSKEPA